MIYFGYDLNLYIYNKYNKCNHYLLVIKIDSQVNYMAITSGKWT